ncbi:dipeptidase [Sporomusaceae bacterium FL31]|nr:dipeptidase [Sporomusaceae bacterium FL31]GCE35439.1 dipeptidase [Sporomusaceae bacterium]
MKLIDLHCDTISVLYKLTQAHAGGLKANNLHVDLQKLAKANSLAQFFAMYINLEATENPLEDCLGMIDCFYREIEKNQDLIQIATCMQEFELNQKSNKITAFLTIEEGGVIHGKLSNLRMFHRLGVRLMTLTWNYPNEIGYPNCLPECQHQGLTPFGQEVVAEMNRLNMLIDVSHLSDQGFYDVAQYSAKPFVASHSNARAITAHPRNLDDAMIKTLAEKGGVMGINFANSFLGTSPISRVEDIVQHIKHIRNTGGIDVLALGSDFDGIEPNLEIANIGEIDKLVQALMQHSFREEEIEKIFTKNIMRVMRECLG